MLPTLKINDVFNVGLAKSVFRSQGGLTYSASGVAASNLANVGFGQSRVVMLLTGVLAAMSAFRNLVLHVAVVVSAKQMIRAHARWIVAMVRDYFGQPAKADKEGIAMCAQSPAPAAKLSVAVSIAPKAPFPTIALWTLTGQLINLAPKAPHNVNSGVRRQGRWCAGITPEAPSDFSFRITTNLAYWVHLLRIPNDIGILKGKSIG